MCCGLWDRQQRPKHAIRKGMELNRSFSGKFTVYVIEHIASGKSYVGVTEWPDGRRKTHFNSPRAKFAIGRAIREFGSDAFTWREVDKARDWHEAMVRESFWVHL